MNLLKNGVITLYAFLAMTSLWASDSFDTIPSCVVDLVEHNHFYDENGKKVFDQLLFYDWNPATGRYDVREWRLVKDQSQVPVFDSASEFYESVYFEHDNLVKISARSYRESWTQYDPELEERSFLAMEQRKLLPISRQQHVLKEIRMLLEKKPETEPDHTSDY